jgi:hypothetical protein
MTRLISVLTLATYYTYLKTLRNLLKARYVYDGHPPSCSAAKNASSVRLCPHALHVMCVARWFGGAKVPPHSSNGQTLRSIHTAYSGGMRSALTFNSCSVRFATLASSSSSNLF